MENNSNKYLIHQFFLETISECKEQPNTTQLFQKMIKDDLTQVLFIYLKDLQCGRLFNKVINSLVEYQVSKNIKEKSNAIKIYEQVLRLCDSLLTEVISEVDYEGKEHSNNDELYKQTQNMIFSSCLACIYKNDKIKTSLSILNEIEQANISNYSTICCVKSNKVKECLIKYSYILILKLILIDKEKSYQHKQKLEDLLDKYSLFDENLLSYANSEELFLPGNDNNLISVNNINQ